MEICSSINVKDEQMPSDVSIISVEAQGELVSTFMLIDDLIYSDVNADSHTKT